MHFVLLKSFLRSVLTFKIARNATLSAGPLNCGIYKMAGSLFVAFSACNSPTGAFRGQRARIAFAADKTTKFDSIAVYASVSMYLGLIVLFVLDACFPLLILVLNYF